MNHLFRLFWLLFTAPTRQPVDPNNPFCATHMRVWPTDIDVLMHMNNGVYLSLMDLGRVDLMLRMGAFKRLKKLGIYPVLASEAIRFKRSLKPFQKFSIETRLAGWDDKYIYLGQKFVSRGDLYSSAMVKARFLRKDGGKVAPKELWEIMGATPKEIAPEAAVSLLQSLESELRD